MAVGTPNRLLPPTPPRIVFWQFCLFGFLVGLFILQKDYYYCCYY